MDTIYKLIYPGLSIRPAEILEYKRSYPIGVVQNEFKLQTNVNGHLVMPQEQKGLLLQLWLAKKRYPKHNRYFSMGNPQSFFKSSIGKGPC